MDRKNAEISMVSCVSYTNKNQVYDRQSLSAPACVIWFWKNQLYCFSRIASAVSVSSSSGPVEIEHRFAIPPQGDFRGSAFLISKSRRLLVMFHPVVKNACSYLNCSFCPHCFFLQFSLLLPLGMMYITINQRRSQRNFRHILHKEKGRKLYMIPTKKQAPRCPVWGICEKGKTTRRKRNHAGQGNTAAVRAAAP